ncbi:MAG TPA: type II toxin-antitoxin system RelE/ParE family toxin, partial [Burkholderiaceae bacterium]|nr:type II toxin-antitoxin system RelE/ParE family toxin [Burkholderiaceae bacterium]
HFIAQESPLAAQRVAAKLTAAAASLHRHPQRGRRVPELMGLQDPIGLSTHDLEIRELIVRPWRLTFVIEGRSVRVVAVVDCRRDMLAWLERHLTRFGSNP